MPDFGTLIADSKGILHDVSKHAFDAVYSELGHGLTTNDAPLVESFTQAFSSFKRNIGEKYGVNLEDGVTLEDVGRQLKDQLMTTGGRLAAEAIAGYGIKAAAELEGPLGLLVSEGLSIIASEITFALVKGEEYLPGQWVFLDYGIKNRLINQAPKVVQIAQSFDLFSASEMLDIPDELDYLPEAKHSVGFILQKEESGYEWSVFSFYTGHEEKLHAPKS